MSECVCVCIHVCVYTCACVCVHACMCMRVCMCVCKCMCVCMCMCVHAHACVCTHVCIHVCVQACGHVLDKKESWVFTSAALVVVRTAVYQTSHNDYLTSFHDQFRHLTAVTTSHRFEKCLAQSLSH